MSPGPGAPQFFPPPAAFLRTCEELGAPRGAVQRQVQRQDQVAPEVGCSTRTSPLSTLPSSLEFCKMASPHCPGGGNWVFRSAQVTAAGELDGGHQKGHPHRSHCPPILGPWERLLQFNIHPCKTVCLGICKSSYMPTPFPLQPATRSHPM